jgi:hypothetical protein
VGSVVVTPTLQDISASMTVNGQPTTSEQARSITLLGPGSNTFINVNVTAQNGNQNNYVVVVIRAASGDNNLSALTVTPGPLAPAFAAGTLDYTVNVATDVTSVDVSATKADPNAVLSGSVPNPGAGQATGQATISLNGPGTQTIVSITVTAPSGASKTYTITVNRALSGNNNLSALTVTPGPLAPVFDSATLVYTVDVASDVTHVDVSATKADPNAVLSGSVADPGAGQATGQATIPLNGAGAPTPVAITVTAPNGDFKIYTITINRAP